MKYTVFLVGIALLVLILPACATGVSRTVTPPTLIPTQTPTRVPKPTLELISPPVVVPTPTTIPTSTPTPIPIPTAIPSPTPMPTPLPERDHSELPHVFVGTITIGGERAPDGVEVSVWLPEFDSPIGSGLSSGGDYSVLANQHGSKSFGGRSLIFKVNGQDAGESATWEKGGATILDLSLN